MRSADGGASWSRQAAGLERPQAAAAVAWFDGRAYLSDGTGVFVWRPASGSWARTSAQASVGVLSPVASGTLYAASPTDVRALSGGRWTDLGQPAPAHVHQGHVIGGAPAVTSALGRLYAAGTSQGVSASADGGWTWTQLAGGLGGSAPGAVVEYGGALWAATSDGLYRYPLPAPAGGATPEWWGLLLAGAVALGLAAAGVAALDPRRRRRGPPSSEA